MKTQSNPLSRLMNEYMIFTNLIKIHRLLVVVFEILLLLAILTNGLKAISQITCPATGTTSVFSGLPSQNFNGSSLIVGDESGGEFRSFLIFDLNVIPPNANIVSAEMRIYYYNGSYCIDPINIKLYRVSNSWNPNTITWNNQPNYYSSSYGSWWPSYQGSYFDLPVTELVLDWLQYGNNGMLLKKNSGTGCSEFYQLNSSYPPYIMVTYTLSTMEVIQPNGGENWAIGATHQIVWNDNISENVKIELYKSGSQFDEIDSSTPSDGIYNWTVSTSYPPGNDYQIRIQSINNNVWDISDSYFALFSSSPPPAPSEIQAEAISASQINVIWTNVEGEDGYKLFRRENGGSYHLIATISSNFYHDYTVSSGNEYCYKVRAYNAAGDSPFSPEDCAYPLPVGIDDKLFSKNVLVSPNPCEGQFILSIYNLTGSKIISISIYSTDGTLCYNDDFHIPRGGHFKHGFDFSWLSDGIYLLRCMTSKDLISIRLIIEH